MYSDDLIVKRVPQTVRMATRRNMDVYCMSLYDAFNVAVREHYHNKNTRLWRAWYEDDYREYIPSAYYPKYLDFNKYPLPY